MKPCIYSSPSFNNFQCMAIPVSSLCPSTFSPLSGNHCSNPPMTSYLILNKILSEAYKCSQPPSLLCPHCTLLLPLCHISSLLFLKHIRIFLSQGLGTGSLCPEGTGYSPDGRLPPPPPGMYVPSLPSGLFLQSFPTAWFC